MIQFGLRLNEILSSKSLLKPVVIKDICNKTGLSFDQVFDVMGGLSKPNYEVMLGLGMTRYLNNHEYRELIDLWSNSDF